VVVVEQTLAPVDPQRLDKVIMVALLQVLLAIMVAVAAEVQDLPVLLAQLSQEETVVLVLLQPLQDHQLLTPAGAVAV
jgi:energy-converting hydrogenase Eha subunit C